MISAKVICDSISEAGVRLTTFEIEVPRIVWSELMTHRMFSRNAASSRAIPFAKMSEQLIGRPVSFGKNQTGMQAGEEHGAFVNGREVPGHPDATFAYSAEEAWEEAKKDALFWSKAFADAGYHKQCFNRLTEPFQCIKAVVSATEFQNFFYLRKDAAADPTIHRLAQCMYEAQENSNPTVLKVGEWHLPYIGYHFETYSKFGDGEQTFVMEGEDEISLEDAIKVSCARTAAVSFRNVDYGLEKCLQVYDRLLNSGKLHGSALEHAATPMDFTGRGHVNQPEDTGTWQQGVSHMTSDGELWSGNFKGFIQHRKTIKGENMAERNNYDTF